ncbi:MAG TPA: molybdopterin-dependent oxidoreductase, partial [Candidatus Rifleibacterium sp.]|nr:molybdopterin-dependent oxidoreductase [Candidatus Rifleibacterium sp.]
PFAAHFAEVEVDTETGEVKVLKYVAGVDCGNAINPQLADAQTQGAALNGISYAMTEEFIFSDNGRMLNPNFGNYKIFSTKDMPEVETFLVPTYEKTGPYGAKSVSEISINGALPAIGNAIRNAVGIRLTRPPFTAEKVLAALKEQAKSGKKASSVKAETEKKPEKASKKTPVAAKATKPAKAEKPVKPAKPAAKKAKASEKKPAKATAAKKKK